MNTFNPNQNDETRKKHDAAELRRYNTAKRKKNLKIYGWAAIIIMLALIWIILQIIR